MAYLNIYWEWSDTSGFTGTYSYIHPAIQYRPSVVPTALKYSPSGNAILYGQGGAPGLRAYRISQGYYIYQEFTVPADTGLSTVSAIEFTKDGTVVILGGSGTVNYAAYKWNDATGFGAKLSGPANFPFLSSASGRSIHFSPDETKVVITSPGAAGIAAYNFSKTTGFGSKLAGPSGATATGVNISTKSPPNKDYLVRALSVSPYLEVIRWNNDGFGSVVPTPAAVTSALSTGVAEILLHGL